MRTIQLEGNQITGTGNDDIALVSEQALEFRHGLCRKYEIALVALRKLQLAFKQRQTATISSDKGKLVFRERKKNSIEHITRLITGNGVGSLAQAVFEFSLFHGERTGLFEMREGRIFLLGKTEDFEKTRTAANRGRVFCIHFDDDFGVHQLADDRNELSGRYGDRACLFDSGFDTAADAHIQVGGSEGEAGFIGLKECVGENRERRACADDILDALQSFEQGFFGDCDLHLVAWMFRERKSLCQRGRETLVASLTRDVLHHGTELGVPDAKKRPLIIKSSLPRIAHGKNFGLKANIVGSRNWHHGQANPDRLGIAVASPHHISKATGGFVKRDRIGIVDSRERVATRCKDIPGGGRDGIRIRIVNRHCPDST